MAKLTVVPVNGIGNRLRAIAASRLLAEKLGREFNIVWEPEPNLPGSWKEVFGENSFLPFFTREAAVTAGLIPDTDFPFYLQEVEGFVSLRGHDRGEQPFAKSFFRLLQTRPDRDAVVIAGDCFHPAANSVKSACLLLASSRMRLFRELVFSSQVIERFQTLRPSETYMSIHLRGTDKVDGMPPTPKIVKAAIARAAKHRVKNVFLGTDDSRLLELARGLIDEDFFSVHYNPNSYSRTSPEGTFNSFAEYLVMATGSAFVGNANSTFSTEISIVFPSSRRLLI